MKEKFIFQSVGYYTLLESWLNVLYVQTLVKRHGGKNTGFRPPKIFIVLDIVSFVNPF